MRQLTMPVFLQLCKLCFTLCMHICIAVHHCFCLCIILHAEYKCNLLALARCQCNLCLQSATGVTVIIETISAIAVFYTDRIAISMISAKERFLISGIACNLCASQAKESCKCNTSVDGRALIHILIDYLLNAVSHEICSCDKECILQIDLILLIVVVIRKFTVTKDGQVTWLVRIIRNLQLPYLMCLIQWYIVKHRALDTRIFCIHIRIACAMVTLTLVTVQIFSYRLPGS